MWAFVDFDPGVFLEDENEGEIYVRVHFDVGEGAWGCNFGIAVNICEGCIFPLGFVVSYTSGHGFLTAVLWMRLVEAGQAPLARGLFSKTPLCRGA